MSVTETNTIGLRLREVADTLDGLNLPDTTHVSADVSRYPEGIGGQVSVHIHCQTVEDLRAVRRAVGKVDKTESSSGAGMLLRGEVGGVKVTIWPPDDTCKRVQVGTETVEREVPTATETFTEEVPVYEWDCGDVLRDEQVPA